MAMVVIGIQHVPIEPVQVQGVISTVPAMQSEAAIATPYAFWHELVTLHAFMNCREDLEVARIAKRANCCFSLSLSSGPQDTMSTAAKRLNANTAFTILLFSIEKLQGSFHRNDIKVLISINFYSMAARKNIRNVRK